MGRDNGRGGRGASRGGRGGRGPSRRTTTTEVRREKLATAKPELVEHIFYINKPDQAHNFIETKKKILWYLGEKLDDGGVMMNALEEEKDFNETKPLWCERNPDGTPKKDGQGQIIEKKVDKEDVGWCEHTIAYKEWRAKMNKYDENKVKTCGIILGQCTKAVLTKLEAKVEWDMLKHEILM